MAKTKKEKKAKKAKEKKFHSRKTAESFLNKLEVYMESKMIEPGSSIYATPIPLKVSFSQGFREVLLQGWKSLDDLNYLVGSQKNSNPLDPLIEKQYNLMVRHFDELYGDFSDSITFSESLSPIVEELRNAAHSLWKIVEGLNSLSSGLTYIDSVIRLGIKISSGQSFDDLEECHDDVNRWKEHYPYLYSMVPLTQKYLASEVKRRKGEGKEGVKILNPRDKIAARIARYEERLKVQ